MLEGRIHHQLLHHHGYQAIQAIDGVGRTIAAVLVAEIATSGGSVPPRRCARGPGLTPKHRQSDSKSKAHAWCGGR
jgi:Transposase IS116/IS110/IS902 family